MFTGWARVLLKKIDALPKELRELSDNRIKICDKCPMRTINSCSKYKYGVVEKDFMYKGNKRTAGQRVKGCGCNLSAKTLEKDQQCPLGKW